MVVHCYTTNVALAFPIWTLERFGGAGMEPEMFPLKSGTTGSGNVYDRVSGIGTGALLIGVSSGTPAMTGFVVVVTVYVVIGTNGAKDVPEKVAVEPGPGETVSVCPKKLFGHNVVGTNSYG